MDGALLFEMSKLLFQPRTKNDATLTSSQLEYTRQGRGARRVDDDDGDGGDDAVSVGAGK